MVLIDQKMIALFSLLFGVGVVILAERAEAKGRRVAILPLTVEGVPLAGALILGAVGARSGSPRAQVDK